MSSNPLIRSKEESHFMSINLLPPEILVEQVKKGKFYRIQVAGVVIVLIMIFLSSLTVFLRILQSRNIAEVQAKTNEQQQKISGFQNAEASLFILKNRLTVINQYLGVSSKQASIYKIIDSLVTPSLMINSVTIDKAGDTVLLVSATDPADLDNLIGTLTVKDTNEDKISQVSIDSLSRSKDGLYRVSLKVKAK